MDDPSDSHNNSAPPSGDWQVNSVTCSVQKSLGPPVKNRLPDQPVLLLDFSKLVTESVFCGSQNVLAVVDTGAAVTVISPQLQQRTEFALCPWVGPRIVMANGVTATPLGSATISIQYFKGTARGVAVVLKMDGIDLLFGNDFLKQFGRLQIDYLKASTLLTLGELPLAAITAEAIDTPIAQVKITAAEGTEIPPFSVVNVATHSPPVSAAQLLFTPSMNLLKTKAVSAGHAIVNTDVTVVPIANLSSVAVWLHVGAVLGTIEPYADDVVVCNFSLPTSGLADTTTPKYSPSDTALFSEKLKSRIGRDITTEQRDTVLQLLLNYINCFAVDDSDHGKCNVAEHDIDTGSATAVHQVPYTNAWKARQVIQYQVDTMLTSGIIETSDSPWASPVVLVKKKDWRFCVDYRKLNAVTVRDVYPLPRIADALSRLEGSNFFPSWISKRGTTKFM